RAAVQVLPRVLDPVLVPADEGACYVVPQVRRDGEFATVECRVAPPDDTVGGDDLEAHEVASGTRDDDVDGRNAHGSRFLPSGVAGAECLKWIILVVAGQTALRGSLRSRPATSGMRNVAMSGQIVKIPSMIAIGIHDPVVAATQAATTTGPSPVAIIAAISRMTPVAVYRCREPKSSGNVRFSSEASAMTDTLCMTM